jgi:hypothetical protein
MGFRLPGIRRSSSKAVDEVPKGYLAVYVGDKMKRFMIPEKRKIQDPKIIRRPILGFEDQDIVDGFPMKNCHNS